MSLELSEFDRRLLDALQHSVPLVPRPWEDLARQLGATEERTVSRVAALSGAGGIIREIAGLFDAAALGYATTLVAARCSEEHLEAAGRQAAGHPGVSHCYARQGELNLWFTLAVGPDSTLGLDRTVTVLGQLIGAERILSLPAIRRYKLRARFDMVSPAGSPRQAHDQPGRSAARAAAPTPEQLRAIAALQEPLPAQPEPFLELARGRQMSAEELLVHAADFLAAGWMRRYAAVLRHQAAGAAANVLVAWQVPPERADRFGAQAAQFGNVSHCYLRASGPGWPWNLYTMIHGRDRAEVERTVEAVAAAAGAYPRVALPTAREYKKARVRLFSPECRRWEAAVLD
ncbi:MAG: hypothetical protein AMJ81_02645 [Phycisphaerae bacterium SM23_33]|nr:MAG: hypothetical protein AMJ81_02645 [Phycisphaerae bacterium SM23_33]